jgi:hypothetical protein
MHRRAMVCRAGRRGECGAHCASLLQDLYQYRKFEKLGLEKFNEVKSAIEGE